ncbi:MAG TPA: glycosyltransferase family 4 protein [Cellvibrionaceae bacterium]
MPSSLPSILHAIDTTGPGGAETVFLDLVQQLIVPNYKNIALIKGPGWVEDQLIKRQIEYFILKPRGLLSIPYYVDVLALLRKQQVKLVQANLLGSTLTFSILAMILRIPLVATLHGRVDIDPKERFIRLKNLLMRLGVSQLITVSDDLRRYIAERKLFPLTSITTIYNGINIRRYKTALSSNLRAHLNLEKECLLVGSIGNIRPAKDYANLVQAARIVINTNPLVHFVIAGHPKAELMAELTRLVAELNISSNVHFVGFWDDTPGFLSQIDVFALSSISEGFSIATLEAMAAGVPVVATRCGGPEEIITNELDGSLVPTKNPQALASAISHLLTLKERAQALCNNATLTVQRRFSIEVMFEHYRAIYQRLLAPKP